MSPAIEAMPCDGCEEKHTEWSKAGSRAVHTRDGGGGVAYQYECDRCGEVCVLLGL